MMGLLEKLLGRPAPPDAPAAAGDDARLAVAALLVEAGSVDGKLDPDEHQRILRVVGERLGLGPWVARELVERASGVAAEGADWQGYTRVIKDAFDAEGRIGIVEMLWEIVLADGTLHDYEASLMRRVPALLYVDDRANAQARDRARARLRRA